MINPTPLPKVHFKFPIPIIRQSFSLDGEVRFLELVEINGAIVTPMNRYLRICVITVK